MRFGPLQRVLEVSRELSMVGTEQQEINRGTIRYPINQFEVMRSSRIAHGSWFSGADP
jgi:hypothetical protein